MTKNFLAILLLLSTLASGSVLAPGNKTGKGGSSPLTTKGDIYGFGSADCRIPVGTNGQFFTADSAQTCGAKWSTPGAGSGNVVSINGDATAVATLTAGSAGTDFAIVDNAAGDHLFNIPTASATARGLVSTGAQTIAGVKTISSQPILSSLTASQAVFTDSSKGLVSNAITGTGNVVMSASPTMSGTVTLPSGTVTSAAWDTGTSTLTSNGVAFTAKAPLASPTFTGTVTLPSGSVTASAWDTGSSTFTSNGVAYTAKAPLASPTFTGTVTLPSGSVSTSAWDTGTSTLTSNGVAFTAKAPLASPTFTGTVTLPSGTVSTSAWDTGTSTLTSNGVAFTAKAPLASPTFTGTVTVPAAVVGLIETFNPLLTTGANATYALDAKSAYAYTVNSILGLATTSGTITVDFKIGGTVITGCNALSVTSTPQDATCTAANTVSSGGQLTMVTSSNATAVNLIATVKTTR